MFKKLFLLLAIVLLTVFTVGALRSGFTKTEEPTDTTTQIQELTTLTSFDDFDGSMYGYFKPSEEDGLLAVPFYFRYNLYDKYVSFGVKANVPFTLLPLDYMQALVDNDYAHGSTGFETTPPNLLELGIAIGFSNNFTWGTEPVLNLNIGEQLTFDHGSIKPIYVSTELVEEPTEPEEPTIPDETNNQTIWQKIGDFFKKLWNWILGKGWTLNQTPENAPIDTLTTQTTTYYA